MGVTGEGVPSSRQRLPWERALSSSASESWAGQGANRLGWDSGGARERSLCRDRNHHEECGCRAFSMGDGAVEGCFFRLGFTRRAAIEGCGAVDLGLLHGQGDVGVPSSATRPWFDVAPLARFRWDLAEHWFVEASAALVVPLRRETFIFDPRTVFFEVPVAGPAAAVGIGYAFGDRPNQSRP